MGGTLRLDHRGEITPQGPEAIILHFAGDRFSMDEIAGYLQDTGLLWGIYTRGRAASQELPQSGVGVALEDKKTRSGRTEEPLFLAGNHAREAISLAAPLLQQVLNLLRPVPVQLLPFDPDDSEILLGTLRAA